MAEHMLQGATLAERNGKSEEIVVAALLHDIGHFVGGAGAFSITMPASRPGCRRANSPISPRCSGAWSTPIPGKRLQTAGGSGEVIAPSHRVGAERE